MSPDPKHPAFPGVERLQEWWTPLPLVAKVGILWMLAFVTIGLAYGR